MVSACRMHKPFFFVLAWASLSLGTIGVFIPLLPSVPLWILAAYLFSKSSPRFHAWVYTLPRIGEALRDWNENKVINKEAKIVCALTITVSLWVIWTHQKIPGWASIVASIMLLSVLMFVISRKSRE
jgi:uncharacterized membrane protein YbaN (DUF454 family)